MTHSDDTGLILPPKVAPVQVVVVPIWRKEKERGDVHDFAGKVFDRLKAAGVRVKLDDRATLKPGAKYFEWERKGVPLRLEIGPRDVKNGAAFCAKRTGGKKFGLPVDEALRDLDERLFVATDDLVDEVKHVPRRSPVVQRRPDVGLGGGRGCSGRGARWRAGVGPVRTAWRIGRGRTERANRERY